MLGVRALGRSSGPVTTPAGVPEVELQGEGASHKKLEWTMEPCWVHALNAQVPK